MPLARFSEAPHLHMRLHVRVTRRVMRFIILGAMRVLCTLQLLSEASESVCDY